MSNVLKLGNLRIIQNSIFILLILIAGFELLNRGVVKEIDWRGFRITNWGYPFR